MSQPRCNLIHPLAAISRQYPSTALRCSYMSETVCLISSSRYTCRVHQHTTFRLFIRYNVNNIAHNSSKLIDAVLYGVAEMPLCCNITSCHQLDNRQAHCLIVLFQKSFSDARANFCIVWILHIADSVKNRDHTILFKGLATTFSSASL